jgi:hypothetical protein
MGTAPTELISEGILDVLVARIAIAIQQGFGGHDHAVRAVAALGGLLVDESSLQRMRLLQRAQSLESGDRISPDVSERDGARPGELSADQRGTSTALAEAAAEFGAVQSEIVPQHVEQRSIVGGVDHMALAIDVNSVRHPSPIAE